LAAIARITKAEVGSDGAPRIPLIEHLESTGTVYNNPALAARFKGGLESALGKDNVVIGQPTTASEDFVHFIEQGIPSEFFWLGGADPQKFAQAAKSGEVLPSNHSPLLAPDLDPALRTASPRKWPCFAIC